MKYLVYRHTSPSGKVYIGITHHTDPNKRWRNGHGYSDSIAFHNAIVKYGWDNFKHEILADNLNENDAKQMEMDLIASYPTRQTYNISAGGESAWGIKHSPETKLKIGNSCKSNRWINKGGVERMIKNNELDKYLAEGWVRGHLHGQRLAQSVTIHKGVNNIRVLKSELDKYLAEGWVRGFSEKTKKSMSGNTHRFWMTNGVRDIRIDINELDKYLAEGWVRGRRTGCFGHN